MLLTSSSKWNLYPIKKLVFKGGGPKAFPYLGAIEVLDEISILAGVERVAGASAGSITAFLLAIGYSVAELKEILLNSDFSKFQDTPLSSLPFAGNPIHVVKSILSAQKEALPGILLKSLDWNRIVKTFDSEDKIQEEKQSITQEVAQAIRRNGVCKGKEFTNWLEDLLKRKNLSVSITFADLHKLTINQDISMSSSFRDLQVVAVNVDTGQAEIFDYQKTPNIAICDAVRASMSIPFAFQAPKNANGEYTDGGALNNYPITINDADGRLDHETLGIRIDTADEIAVYRDAKAVPLNKQDHFAVKLVKTLIAAQDSQEFHQINKFRTIYIEVSDVGLLEFDLPKVKKQELVKRGKQAVKDYFNQVMIELQGKAAFYERFPQSLQDKFKYDRMVFKNLLSQAAQVAFDQDKRRVQILLTSDAAKSALKSVSDMYGIAELTSIPESKRTNVTALNTVKLESVVHEKKVDMPLQSDTDSKDQKDAPTIQARQVVSFSLVYDFQCEDLLSFLSDNSTKQIAYPIIEIQKNTIKQQLNSGRSLQETKAQGELLVPLQPKKRPAQLSAEAVESAHLLSTEQPRPVSSNYSQQQRRSKMQKKPQGELSLVSLSEGIDTSDVCDVRDLNKQVTLSNNPAILFAPNPKRASRSATNHKAALVPFQNAPTTAEIIADGVVGLGGEAIRGIVSTKKFAIKEDGRKARAEIKAKSNEKIADKFAESDLAKTKLREGTKKYALSLDKKGKIHEAKAEAKAAKEKLEMQKEIADGDKRAAVAIAVTEEQRKYIETIAELKVECKYLQKELDKVQKENVNLKGELRKAFALIQQLRQGSEQLMGEQQNLAAVSRNDAFEEAEDPDDNSVAAPSPSLPRAGLH